MAEKPIFM